MEKYLPTLFWEPGYVGGGSMRQTTLVAALGGQGYSYKQYVESIDHLVSVKSFIHQVKQCLFSN